MTIYLAVLPKKEIVGKLFIGSGHYWLLLKIIIIIKPFLIKSNGERLIA